MEVYNLSSLDITAGSNNYIKNVYTATSGSSNLIYEGDYIFYNDNGTYYLMSYTGTATEITLPDNINGNSYSIYDYAFCFCSKLKSVIIPNNVTSIGDLAFAYCSSLTSVTIPDSVTIIGGGVFGCCTSLTNVTIGSGVTAIGNLAFYECSSLNSVTFENTNGWYVTTTEGDTSGTDTDVTVASTNVNYLTNTYCSYYWYRK